MITRLLAAIQAKRVRRCASTIALRAAERAPLSETADLIPALSDYVGKPVRLLHAASIDTEGIAVESDSAFTIYLAQDANREMTLAHELGHIALGHKCCTISDRLPERGALMEWGLAVEESLEDQARMAEREADIFADQVLMLIEVARAGGKAHALRWAAGNSS